MWEKSIPQIPEALPVVVMDQGTLLLDRERLWAAGLRRSNWV